MAHKGKFFPIYQRWRLYTPEAQSLAGYPPAVARLRTQNWATTYTRPPINTWINMQPAALQPPYKLLRYQSSLFGVPGHSLRVMLFGEVYGLGFMRWKIGCIDNGVDQIPWGWRDTPNHYPWWPGYVDNILIPPPPGATFSPHGVTEIMGVPWP